MHLSTQEVEIAALSIPFPAVEDWTANENLLDDGPCRYEHKFRNKSETRFNLGLAQHMMSHI